MKGKHTPGPWFYDSGCFYADCQLDRHGQTSEAPIAEMLQGRPDDAIGNAKLIAAAPEMLECLKDIMSSGIVKHDPRIDYDEFQIDRDTQEQARRLLERLK